MNLLIQHGIWRRRPLDLSLLRNAREIEIDSRSTVYYEIDRGSSRSKKSDANIAMGTVANLIFSEAINCLTFMWQISGKYIPSVNNAGK